MYKYITNSMLEDFIRGASDFIEQTGREHAIIVGVSRGGLIPAVYVSHQTDVPMVPIDYSAEEGRGTSKHTNIIPPLDKYQVIYIIDDIVDTGITVQHLRNWLEHKGHIVYVLSLIYKKHSCIIPDYCLLDSDDGDWIVFPWEKKPNGKESEEVEKNEGPP